MMAKYKVFKGKKFFWGFRCNIIGLNKKNFNVKAMFSENCTYKLNENYDQVNKLTGQSFNLFPFYDKNSKSFKSGHHKNSVRFGWRCLNSEDIEIVAYAYIDKIRKQEVIASIKPEEWVHLNFIETGSEYIFTIVQEDGETNVVKFKKTTTKKGFMGLFIYRLYPYFGGRIAAPHKMNIYLKYLKKFA